MKKVIAVSALAMAGVFSAQALADRGKTGFYVTGKAGASVVTQTDQRFRQDFGDDVYKYKGGDKNDTVFGAGLAVGYDFYQHYNVPVRTEVEFCVFRSIRSRIGIEVRSAIRIHSINRELNFFYRFLTRFFAAFHYRGIFPQ